MRYGIIILMGIVKTSFSDLCRVAPGGATLLKLTLRIALRRNRQLLARTYVVRVLQTVFVRVENPHVHVRVTIELLADLRQRVTGFDCIGLDRLPAATACRCTLSLALANAQVRDD